MGIFPGSYYATGMGPFPAKRAVRIANASGFLGDRQRAFTEVIEGGPVDVVTGDYLAEVTMMVLGKQQAKNPQRGYATTFLGHLEPVLARVMARGIKVVVNAGGLNPSGLAAAVRELAARVGLAPKVATLEGDDLRGRLGELGGRNEGFKSLESGAPLPLDPGFVKTANAYLGAWGIVRALEEEADIVICPRVTDASLVIGAAAWWHGWRRDDWNALAGALAAGHVIECGPQATGGNYSSFRELGMSGLPAFPLAEISADGSSVITKHPGTPGRVTVGTVTAQLVYEINSPRYLNPDVVGHLDTLSLEEEVPDRVSLKGAQGSPPPPTTKVAVTSRGTFHNELTFAFVGLNVEEKMRWFERTTRAALADQDLFLTFQRIGAAAPDASTQEAATVLLRVIASSNDDGPVSRAFSAALIEQALSSYPGLFALGVPGPGTEVSGYWPTLVSQADLRPTVTFPDGRTEAVPLPPGMETPAPFTSTAGPGFPSGTPTRRGPLGTLVDARSGDKGCDANLGLWVRSDAAYAWLEAMMTVAKLQVLLPEAAGLRIERYTLPRLRALNFVLHDLLAGGAVATLRFDRQAKALGEFIRSRHVELPISLLPRPGA